MNARAPLLLLASLGCAHAPAPAPGPAEARATVRQIQIEGARQLPVADVKAALPTREGDIVFYSPGAPWANEGPLTSDLQAIEGFYFDRGFIMAKVSAPSVTLSEGGKALDVTFHLQEGDLFSLGEVTIAGVTDAVTSIGARKGQPFSRKALAKDVAALLDRYQSRGYARTQVVPITEVDPAARTVNLRIEVTLGTQLRLERIAISGNARIREDAIRAAAGMREGDLFSESAVQRAKENIGGLGFEAVEIHDAPGSDESKVVLSIALREAAPSHPFPISLELGLPVVDVRINDRGPYRFVLDTGASESMVSRALAAELQLDVHSPQNRISDSSGAVLMPDGAVKLEAMEIGDRRFTDVEVEVVDFTMPAWVIHRTLGGILGVDLFHNLVLVLDYPRSTVELTYLGAPEPDSKTTLPFEYWDGVPAIDLGLSGHPHRFQIDSGFNGWVDLAGDAAQELTFSTPFVAVGKSAALGGEMMDDRAARLAGDLSLGDYVVRTPILGVSASQSRIGCELLRHFKVTLDQPRRRVRFERADAAPIISPAARTSGVGIAWTGQGAQVAYVLENTPAAKVVKVGDRVTRVEGQPAEGLDGAALSKLTHTRPAISLSLERAGKAIEVEVPVVELLAP